MSRWFLGVHGGFFRDRRSAAAKKDAEHRHCDTVEESHIDVTPQHN